MKFDLWLSGICSSRVFTYLVFMTYAAALPVLQREWEMSAATTGSISSGFQKGSNPEQCHDTLPGVKI